MYVVLLRFWVTVKAVTLKFKAGHGSAISSAQEGKKGSIYMELISCLSRANVRAFHENPDRIYTGLTAVNP